MHGVIDDGTLVWGQGLIDWLPVKNVRTLVPQIRTVEGIRHALPSQHALQAVRAEAHPCFSTGMGDMCLPDLGTYAVLCHHALK